MEASKTCHAIAIAMGQWRGYGSQEVSVPSIQGNEGKHNPTGKDLKKDEAMEAVSVGEEGQNGGEYKTLRASKRACESSR